MKRILAWIGIIAIVIGFIALVYFTATGASANVIMATLFAMIVIPFILYALLMITKMVKPDDTSDKK